MRTAAQGPFQLGNMLCTHGVFCIVSTGRILIIVENLTLPLDRRVWQEATTLRDAGHTVSVICPTGGQYQDRYECLEGIHIYRHPLPLEASTVPGFIIEYAAALFWEFVLSLKVYRQVGFDVVQACNPPDLIFLVAAFWKYIFAKPFVFDHHDISPELFAAKFSRRGILDKLLAVFERLTFKMADVSLATNETFKQIAIERGGMDRDDVYVVRSIPDVRNFYRQEPNLSLKAGRQHLLGYVGIMGKQDGVDLLIKAMDHIVNTKGRRDIQCAIVGSGTEVPKLKALSKELALEDYITFTGFLKGDALRSALSAFDVGIIPDPKNSYNDKISMNKAFEYMSLAVPFVQFDLTEGRNIAGNAALYAADNSPFELADKALTILDDKDLRVSLIEAGRNRASKILRWENEANGLLAAYQKALRPKSEPIPATMAPAKIA